MQYMGGKERLAPHIVSQLLEHGAGCTEYLEPFMGGGSIFSRMAPHFPGRATGSDANPDLMMMWSAVTSGWDPPTEISQDQYYALKKAEPSVLRGFVGAGCSFGGRWFEGYARSGGRNFCEVARRSTLRKAVGMAGHTLIHADYREFNPTSGTLVYCDPPYAGTKWYSGMPRFDSAEFWRTVQSWADNGAAVLVSEQNAPDGVECVWQKPVHRSLGLHLSQPTSVESLYRVRPKVGD